MKPSVQQLNEINSLCKGLKLDPDVYKNVEEAGKLIFDLVGISMFKKGDLLNGKIAPPNPNDYMGRCVNGKK